MIGRRAALSGLLALPLAGCGDGADWHDIDVSGTSPDLEFTLERAPDGRRVTAADYRGRLVMLYFGYTSCPDVCPLTLQNVAVALGRAGRAAASDTEILFVTVDPDRDTLPVLADYVGLFGPNVAGLRGTPDQLARLARRYRIAYSVTRAGPGQPVSVTHTSILYVFDRDGRARLIVPSLATETPDIPGVASDMRRLAAGGAPRGSWLGRLV